MLGDRDLLLEAVGNLVDNAIKFTPAGTAVTLALRGGPDGTRMSVVDQGPGIPPAERERVLQRFYRTEKSRTVEGSGLGLSLVAAVVALHGFRLRIGAAETGGGVPGCIVPGCIVEVACPCAPASPSWQAEPR